MTTIEQILDVLAPTYISPRYRVEWDIQRQTVTGGTRPKADNRKIKKRTSEGD